MILFRSTLFALVMLIVTPPYALLSLLTFPFPAHARYRFISRWAVMFSWLARLICGIRYEVLGRENLPDKASVILCKHQSAWETMALQAIFPPVAFVLKRELLKIPFFGWGLALMPTIAIDRAAGKDALLQVKEQGSARLAEGFWVTVFPEGTRVALGQTCRYKIGGAALAAHAGAAVVPVAHNAGECWPRNSFLKYPGKIVVSIGPAIDTEGLTADRINAQAQQWIEAEMRRLFPHHYKDVDQPARSAAA